MNPSLPTDPWDLAGIRSRVLEAWTSAPVRFREDANAEEELVLGGYRDRLVTELAQNAADAAIRAQVPGRLLLRLDQEANGEVLTVANTGEGLDADGVQALCTLRASAKHESVSRNSASTRRGDPVGRFGVGFAAVLAVTDEPSVYSEGGGVGFSADRTRAVLRERGAGAPDLADELDRRNGHVPVLRLPFVDPGTPPEGYRTAVRLPLRDRAAAELVRRLLDEVDDTLLLALPGLDEVIVRTPDTPDRIISGVAERWQVLRRDGQWDPALLADRPTEERLRTGWFVVWALPRRAVSARPRTLYAPTPSDEPMDWPALLIASFPLDSSRRHVAPGPVTDALVTEAAAAYADLVAQIAADRESIWPLVPVGLPAGALDGRLREKVLRLLPRMPLLLAADGKSLSVNPRASEQVAGRVPGKAAGCPGSGATGASENAARCRPGAAQPRNGGLPTGSKNRLIRPQDAVALEPPLGQDHQVASLLATGCADLVVLPTAAAAAAAALGIRRLPLAEVIETLPLIPDPAWWGQLYQVLAPDAVDPAVREALAGLCVPLADGRVVRGIRGTVIPHGTSVVAQALGLLGVRAVHPAAEHPLLERLGATPVGPRAALDLPEVRSAARGLVEDDGFWAESADPVDAGDLAPGETVSLMPRPGLLPGPVEAVLMLVRTALEDGHLTAEDLDRLGGLPLLDEHGDPAPAHVLALPGSQALDLFDPEEVGAVHPELVAVWGVEVLRAVGVSEGLSLLRVNDVVLDGDLPEGADLALDAEDWSNWTEHLAEVVADSSGSRVLPGDLVLPDLVVIRDLDLIVEESWPRALALIAADPVLRTVVIDPIRVLVHGGGPVDVVETSSWSAWWLRRRLARGRAWADPSAKDPVVALLPDAPEPLADLDRPLRAALGAVTGLDVLEPVSVDTVLARLACPDVWLDAATLLRIWTRLARMVQDRPDLALVDHTDRVRVLDGAGTRVVASAEAVVVDGPQWWQRTDLGPAVVGTGQEAARALADLFDLPMADDLAAGRVDIGSVEGDGPLAVPSPVLTLLPTAPRSWREHDRLWVDGVEVDWWIGDEHGERIVHAATSRGLADGLAWAAGAWRLRSAVAEVLEDPRHLADLLVAESFEAGGSGVDRAQ